MLSAISAVLSQWRLVLIALVACGLFLIGYKVNGWRNDSLRLADTKAQLQATVDAAKLAEATRLNLADQNRKWVSELMTQDENVRVVVQESIRKVPVYVSRNPECSFGPDVIRLRNRAAGYE